MSRLEACLERPWRVLAVLVPLSLLLALPAVRVSFGGTLLDLLPDRPVARALARVVDAVAADDVDLVMLEGPVPEQTLAASERLARELSTRSTVGAALARVPVTADPTPTALFHALASRGDDATLAALTSRFGPGGAERAAERIETLALAPGGGAMREMLTRDPYDLAPLLGERFRHLGAAVRPRADGAIVSTDGRAQLVVVRARASAFNLPFSDAFAADIDRAGAATRRAFPDVRIQWTGPHAISRATRDLVKNDLKNSSILASILVSAIFLLAMRRVRALAGVGLPLILGTAWTSALAAVALRGLNAISIAFGAIVLGVGMDTGVHLYDRVLAERRRGHDPASAAAIALRALGVPVLTAALTAAAAFASLCASELRALRELGILAAAGEVLTALAIVLLTPVLAAAMERSAPPRIAGADRPWSRAMGVLAGARATPYVVLAGLAAVALAVVFGPAPRLADSVVLVRPRALAPLAVQARVFARFGGEPGQWIVIGDAPDLERALQRSEALERALAPLETRGVLAGFDTVSALAPSMAAQRARLDAVARMDPAAAAERLGLALSVRGARRELFEPGLAALRVPLPSPRDVYPLTGSAAPLVRRFLARRHGRVVFLAYVRPAPGHASEALRAEVTRVIHGVDGSLALTGYPLLEADVRAALRADTLRVGGLAALLVTLLLALSLRSWRRVALALAGVAVEILALFAFLGVAGIRLDAYNLLAVPVLVGITIDEIVFVLHAYEGAAGTPSERARAAVREMTSATTATAAATAAGFLSLGVCRFDALRGLGLVAGVGTLLGLVSAIIVVPAFARLADRRSGDALQDNTSRSG